MQSTLYNLLFMPYGVTDVIKRQSIHVCMCFNFDFPPRFRPILQ